MCWHSFFAQCCSQVYLARVKGRFPADLSHVRALAAIDFERLGADGDGEDVTEENAGRDAASGAGEKRKACDITETSAVVENSEGVTTEGETTSVHVKTRITYQMKKARSIAAAAKKSGPDYGRGAAVRVEDLPERSREAPSREQVGLAEGVGYKHIDEEGVSSAGVAEIHSVLWLQCPIGVLSHRDGVHACDPLGKPSLSGFRSLGYCADTDTSLVECRPYSGRTHQLRLHLQFLGCPIANDPCYGGQLFYGDADRRALALHALREMRRTGAHPLSKVPHFSDPELDSYILHVAESRAASSSSAATPGEREGEEKESKGDEETCEELQGPEESEDDYIVRTCR